MNSGNPLWDYIDHLSDGHFQERNRIPKVFKCDFCKRDFRTGGLQFEFECACDDCAQDGTVRKNFKENGMGDGLIDALFIHANKIEH